MTMIGEVKAGEAQLLDVRTTPEWEEEHAEYAAHIPLDELLSGDTGQLDATKKIYIYCRSGGRAGIAAQYLKQRGFQAENVGSLSDWLSEAEK